MDLWKKTLSLRKDHGENAASPIDIFAMAFAMERLSIVYYPMGNNLSGMCIKGIGNDVIAINSSMTFGRQRFSMAHELYHLYFDDSERSSVCAKTIGVGNVIEKQADQFASYLLMPPDSLSEMTEQMRETGSGKLSVDSIVRLEQYFRVSRQAILYRLVSENELTPQEADTMRQDVIRSAMNLGYDDTLYRPTPKEKQHKTFGYYIQQADRALEQGLISQGKHDELLLSAFRSDLVYGEEPEGGELLD